jgi:hypothetical protein
MRKSLIVVLVAMLVTGFVKASTPMRSLADEQSFVGSYSRITTASAGTVSETLEIKADKTIVWTTNATGKSPVIMTGIWNQRGEVLVVVLGTRDGVQLPAGTRVIFDRQGKKLKGRIYDRTQFGGGELVFQRSDRS